jgi:hypothetical protein
MSDVIVYTTVSIGGGVDGMDHTDKGGVVNGAFLDKKKAQEYGTGYNNVVPIVVDLEENAKGVLRGLSPVDRLSIEEYFKSLCPKIRCI